MSDERQNGIFFLQTMSMCSNVGQLVQVEAKVFNLSNMHECVIIKVIQHG